MIFVMLLKNQILIFLEEVAKLIILVFLTNCTLSIDDIFTC